MWNLTGPNIFTKAMFTWREGTPANRATRLEGLKHSPPFIHATHLTGTVSGLLELSLERSLSTKNVTADQGNFFPSYFSFLHGHVPVLCLKLAYFVLISSLIDCHSVRQITLANGNYENIHFAPPCFRGLSHLG